MNIIDQHELNTIINEIENYTVLTNDEFGDYCIKLCDLGRLCNLADDELQVKLFQEIKKILKYFQTYCTIKSEIINIQQEHQYLEWDE